VPSKGNDSLIIKLLSRTEHKPFMPPKGEDPVLPEEMAVIKLWIDQGAKAPSGIKKRPEIIVGLPPSMWCRSAPSRSARTRPPSQRPWQSDPHLRLRLRRLYPHACGAQSQDARRQARQGRSPVARRFDGLVARWQIPRLGQLPGSRHLDPLTGEQRHKITGFAHMVVAIAFSPDGKLMGVTGGEPTVEGEIKIFEVGTWKLITDIKTATATPSTASPSA